MTSPFLAVGEVGLLPLPPACGLLPMCTVARCNADPGFGRTRATESGSRDRSRFAPHSPPLTRNERHVRVTRSVTSASPGQFT